MTVRELGERMDSRELAEWRALDAIEPIGERRADYRAGVIAAVVANQWRRKGDRPLKPTDFMAFERAPRQAARRDLPAAIQEAFERSAREEG